MKDNFSGEWRMSDSKGGRVCVHIFRLTNSCAFTGVLHSEKGRVKNTGIVGTISGNGFPKTLQWKNMFSGVTWHGVMTQNGVLERVSNTWYSGVTFSGTRTKPLRS